MPSKKVTSDKSQIISKTEKIEKKVNTLSVPSFALDGKESGTLTLPTEVFGAKVNKDLMTQAVRVYTTNLKTFTGSTKTRGQVAGTTAKAYSQKGTGRARHGAKKAPIFVGGGIAFGPKPRNVRLELPKKMKRAALISALSAKTLDNQIFGLSGLEKATGKTKEVAMLLQKVAAKENKDLKSTLIVIAQGQEKLSNAAGNIAKVNVITVNLLNAYDVIRSQMVAFTKEAVEKMSGEKV